MIGWQALAGPYANHLHLAPDRQTRQWSALYSRKRFQKKISDNDIKLNYLPFFNEIHL